jgi:hypothetical protein
VQLESRVRRKGLGKFLIQILQLIANRYVPPVALIHKDERFWKESKVHGSIGMEQQIHRI